MYFYSTFFLTLLLGKDSFEQIKYHNQWKQKHGKIILNVFLPNFQYESKNLISNIFKASLWKLPCFHSVYNKLNTKFEIF
jgi:hypothetical protein